MQLAQQRREAEQGPFELSIGAIGLGQDPRRRALKDMQTFGKGRDLGNVLDGAPARADRRHGLTLEVVVVRPLRGMEDLAFEGIKPRNVGD